MKLVGEADRLWQEGDGMTGRNQMKRVLSPDDDDGGCTYPSAAASLRRKTEDVSKARKPSDAPTEKAAHLDQGSNPSAMGSRRC